MSQVSEAHDLSWPPYESSKVEAAIWCRRLEVEATVLNFGRNAASSSSKKILAVAVD